MEKGTAMYQGKRKLMLTGLIRVKLANDVTYRRYVALLIHGTIAGRSDRIY